MNRVDMNWKRHPILTFGLDIHAQKRTPMPTQTHAHAYTPYSYPSGAKIRISLHSQGTASGIACFWIQTLCFCLRCMEGSQQSWKQQSWLWTCRQTAYLELAPPLVGFHHLQVLGSDGLFQVFPCFEIIHGKSAYMLITQAQAKSELSALAWCCRIPRSSNYHETPFMENDDLQRYDKSLRTERQLEFMLWLLTL